MGYLRHSRKWTHKTSLLRSERWVVAKGSRESFILDEPVIETLHIKFKLLSPSQRLHSLYQVFMFLRCISYPLGSYMSICLCLYYSFYVDTFLYGYYGDLNENVFHRLWYFNIWSPLGGTVLGGGVDLLKEACHCGWGMRVHSLDPFQVCSSCFVLEVEGRISQLYVHASCYHASSTIIDSPPGTIRPNDYYPKSCLGHIWSHQQNVSEVAAQTEDEIWHLSLYHKDSRTQTIGSSGPPQVRAEFVHFIPWSALEYCRHIAPIQWQLIRTKHSFNIKS